MKYNISLRVFPPYVALYDLVFHYIYAVEIAWLSSSRVLYVDKSEFAHDGPGLRGVKSNVLKPES